MSERKIDEATMDNVEILAKLALTPQERQKAMDEMEKILTYVEKLNELDTDQAEPLVHILPDVNVFREDEVTNGDGRKDSLADVCAGTVKTDPARLRQCKRSSGSLQKTDTKVRVPGTCICFHG